MTQLDIVDHLANGGKSEHKKNIKSTNVNNIDVVASEEFQDQENISGPNTAFCAQLYAINGQPSSAVPVGGCLQSLFLLTLMGVLTPVSAHAQHSVRATSTPADIFRHMCLVEKTLQITTKVT